MAVVLAMVLLTAVSCIGIQADGEKPGSTPTLGQELIDLKKARDVGAISYEEFKEVRAKLLAYYD